MVGYSMIHSNIVPKRDCSLPTAWLVNLMEFYVNMMVRMSKDCGRYIPRSSITGFTNPKHRWFTPAGYHLSPSLHVSPRLSTSLHVSPHGCPPRLKALHQNDLKPRIVAAESPEAGDAAPGCGNSISDPSLTQ